MSQPSNETFDDPALKAALKRSVGSETAPQGLRAQVISAMQSAPPASGPDVAQSPRLGFLNRPVGPWTIAAIAAVVVIGTAIWTKMLLFPSPPTRQKLQLSDELVSEMVKRHDQSIVEPVRPS